MKDQERVSKIIDALAPELKTLALNIHDNPELGLQEFKACAWQKELLVKYGFQIEDDFCNLETAYKAVYKGKKQGPKIAFLAEYDALPGLGHGCGHNLIAMVAVGCGIACREFADKYGAEIDVIGTPAEETAGTKVPMSAMGVFKDYDAVMMAHPAFANAESMNTIAMDAYKIEFFGKPAHAASAPHEGINALDAMINFFNLINAMRQETKPDARIHGIITDGGKAANIVPDFVEMQGTLRTLTPELRESMKQSVERIVTLGAETLRGKGEITWGDGMPPLVNDDTVVDLVAAAAEKTIGADRIFTFDSPSLGSEDFSCLFPEYAPGAQFRLGSGNSDPNTRHGIHNSKNTFDEDCIAAGTAVLVQFVRDYLN